VRVGNEEECRNPQSRQEGRRALRLIGVGLEALIMFKNIGRRNPAVSAPPEVDWTGDQLELDHSRRSSEEGNDPEADDYKGRTRVRRLTDGVRKSFTSVVDPGVKGQRHAKVQLEVDLHHVPLTAMRSEIPFACKKGWLYKARTKGDRWLRRYFILTGQLVVYFVNETDSKPKGAFLLHSYAQVEHCGEKVNGREYCFDVDTPERTYYLSADSAEEAKSWGQALALACGESHRQLWCDKSSGDDEVEDKLLRMQQELSKVLIEVDDRIEEEKAQQRRELEEEHRRRMESALGAEAASGRTDFLQARDQLVQWQHLSENLLGVLQSQDMFLGEEQKEKLHRMQENFESLSGVLKAFTS